MSEKNIFPANDVDPERKGGWICDLSPAGVVNPDFYYRFRSRKTARRFARLVADGMPPEQALNLVKRLVRCHPGSDQAGKPLGCLAGPETVIKIRINVSGGAEIANPTAWAVWIYVVSREDIFFAHIFPFAGRGCSYPYFW